MKSERVVFKKKKYKMTTTMKKIKILSLLFMSLIVVSCSNDEAVIDGVDNSNLEGTSFRTIESFNVEEVYFELLKSSDIESEYNALTSNEQSLLWGFKYDLFESSNSLNQKQKLVLNNLKEFSKRSIVNQIYDEDEMNEMSLEVMDNFTDNQFFDLFYYLDIPSVTNSSKICFWCKEITSAGPCEMVTSPQGSVRFVRRGIVRVRRFFIGWTDESVEIPCSELEWFENR